MKFIQSIDHFAKIIKLQHKKEAILFGQPLLSVV